MSLFYINTGEFEIPIDEQIPAPPRTEPAENLVDPITRPDPNH